MSTDGLAVYFLDVGQGDCSLIVPPDGRISPILVDCADAYVARSFVRDHKIETLDAVVVSHLDYDHICGISSFVQDYLDQGFKIKKIVVGIDRDVEKLSGAAKTLLENVFRWRDEGHILVGAPHRESEPKVIADGDGWSVEIVLPFYDKLLQARYEEAEKPNPAAIVIKVNRAGTSLLLGADAPLSSWSSLAPDVKRANVIRVPHHGGDILEGTTGAFEDLYDAVQADMAAVSVGTPGFTRYGHPTPEHINAAKRGGSCRIACTQLTGRCEDDPLPLRPQALSIATTVTYPYRHLAHPAHKAARPQKEVPCAGSILVEISPTGEYSILPSPDHHAQVVDRTSHPLCR